MRGMGRTALKRARYFSAFVGALMAVFMILCGVERATRVRIGSNGEGLTKWLGLDNSAGTFIVALIIFVCSVILFIFLTRIRKLFK